MAIYRLIANGSFGPNEIEVMKVAYEAALAEVGVANRDDPITELIAKSIVNVTASGERDPNEVKKRALNALGVRRSVALDAHKTTNNDTLQRPHRPQRDRKGLSAHR
jgi:hypothetical protein